MELAFKTEVRAESKKIWQYYVDVELRKIWEEDLESLVFNGDIRTGTTGRMKLKEMPEMAFELIDVTPEQSYWDRTDVPGMGSLIFGHDIVNEEGKTFIQHTVRLAKEQPNESDLAFLTGVFADVPQAVLKIKGEVEQ